MTADDFYLSESGLVVLETTDHIFDPTVFDALSTHTLLSWQRVRTALLLANSGEEWVSIFKCVVCFLLRVLLEVHELLCMRVCCALLLSEKPCKCITRL